MSTGHSPPHHEGLDTSSPSPKLASDGPGPDPGEGHRERRAEPLGTGLEDRVEGQALTETKQGRVVSGWGQRGWREAGSEDRSSFSFLRPSSKWPRGQAPTLGRGSKDEILEGVASPQGEPRARAWGVLQVHRMSRSEGKPPLAKA